MNDEHRATILDELFEAKLRLSKFKYVKTEPAAMARFARIEAAIAAVETMQLWEPVPGNEYQVNQGGQTYTLLVSLDGANIAQWRNDNTDTQGNPYDIESVSTGDYRLCRRVKGEVQP